MQGFATHWFGRDGARRGAGRFAVTFGVFISAATVMLASGRAFADTAAQTNIRAGTGITISAVRAWPRTAMSPSSSMTSSSFGQLTLDPFPRPRLGGFLAYVAIAASDQHQTGEFDFAHVPEASYVGTPLSTALPANRTFIVGIVDSGSSGDLMAGSYADKLGLSGSWVTANPVPLSVAGGEIDALCTQAVGVFASGLSAVQPDGTLSLSKLVGHSNVAAIAAPPIECDDGEQITGVVGGPFISLYNVAVRVDTPREVVVDGQRYKGPDVQFLDPTIPLPTPARRIGLDLGGLAPVTTSSYFPQFDDLVTPMIPTMFSMSALDLPTGGGFFTNVLLREGPSSPENPVNTLRMLVDSGSQTSVISETTEALLGLPLYPDFTVDICGPAGVVTNAPGYYVDYVKIPAQGALPNSSLEFSRAPFVVLNLDSPEGGTLDGLLGMNFFWNRNVTLVMPADSSAFLYLSDPLPVPFGDSDVDFDVDMDDANYFFAELTGPAPTPLRPEALHLDANSDDAVDLRDFAVFQRGFTGAHRPGDLNCDGYVNNGDIDPFILALTNSAAYVAQYPGCSINNADINGDGAANNGDIDAFVKLLTGG